LWLETFADRTRSTLRHIIVRATGAVVWAADYNYKPFGEATITTSTITNNIRFPGQYYDAETGNHYNYMRDYNPMIGRYMETDPIGIKQGMNHLYMYAEADPINLDDFKGLLSCMYTIDTHYLDCANNAGQQMITTAVLSGRGTCKDDSSCKEKWSRGPLPPGYYTIKPKGSKKRRPKWLYLDPHSDNEMYNRDAFYIHTGSLSKGCIVMTVGDFKTLAEWAEQDGGGCFMSKVITRISSLFIFLTITCNLSISYANVTIIYDKFFYAVLDAKLQTKKGMEPATIDRLYELKEKSKNSAQQLVQLLDYYIGEGPSEILDQMISEEGKKVLPLLLDKRKKPLECLSKYKTICIDKETRDENIDLLVNAIKEGKVLRVEE
jgi:RHS repeat-associated protein